MKKLLPVLALAPLTFATAADEAKSVAVSTFPPQNNPALNLAIDRFQVPDGLEVSVWATSPLLYNPTNMDIDQAGRVWVAEGVNYRKHENRRPEGDRIIVLEDSDGDGTADKSSVFVQDPGLVAPLGVAVFDNVVVVSQPPDLIVYTDVNRDLKFDPAVDKREVLLTGFNGKNHDHSLHSVIGGPDGLWYFSQGNTGAKFKDRSGKEFRIGSGYNGGGGVYFTDPLTLSGAASDDGHIWVSGFSARMNPDGTHAEVIGHGFRNSYEQTVTSFGDVFQNDNDDPPACRTTWLMEHGFLGFSSPDGKRSWRADQRPGQNTSISEWRQDDPTTIPAGDVYGGGAPTGIAFYENGALDPKWNGLLLTCETGRNTVFGYLPQADGAGYKLERFDFLTSNSRKAFNGSDFTGGVQNGKDPKQQADTDTWFRPSDVCIGADGAIYVSDWFDARTGGHQDLDNTCSGTIYRIAPPGFKSQTPAIDLTTPEGQIAALRSPAGNVRWSGFQALKAAGAKALPAVRKLLSDPNPLIAARAIWILPHLGEEGQAATRALLKHENPSFRITALRALRRSGQEFLTAAETLASDPQPAVRREAALAMWDIPFEKSQPVLTQVAAGYDGRDRSYLAAIGIGSTGQETKLFAALTAIFPKDPAAWTDSMARLAWRLMTPAAVPALQARALAASLTSDQRKLAIDSLAFIQDVSAADALIAVLAALPPADPLRAPASWWIENRADNDWSGYGIDQKLKAHHIDLEAPMVLTSITTPEATAGQNSALNATAILALTGDAARGKIAAQRCIMCHKLGDTGADFGPALTGWGLSQPPEVIVEALLDPSKTIAHGYEGVHLETKDGIAIDGMVLARGKQVTIRSMGGVDQHVPRKIIAKEEPLNRSLMMNAAQLALQPQEVADIVAYLRAGAN